MLRGVEFISTSTLWWVKGKFFRGHMTKRITCYLESVFNSTQLFQSGLLPNAGGFPDAGQLFVIASQQCWTKIYQIQRGDSLGKLPKVARSYGRQFYQYPLETSKKRWQSHIIQTVASPHLPVCLELVHSRILALYHSLYHFHSLLHNLPQTLPIHLLLPLTIPL